MPVGLSGTQFGYVDVLVEIEEGEDSGKEWEYSVGTSELR